MHQDQFPGFLNCWLGGTGKEAHRPFRELHHTEQVPFPQLSVQIDTDPLQGPAFDKHVCLGLDANKLRTIQASPESFGPVVATIITHHSRYLSAEDVTAGSRTVRVLTQLMFEYHRDNLIRELHDGILQLKKQGGSQRIIPVLVSSSGGGAGSALQILLAHALTDPQFVSQVTEGFGADVLEPPLMFVVEPFAYAMRSNLMHRDNILANAYAFRIESAILEAAHAFQYCFHLGIANTRGTVLDSPQEIAMVLGTSVYQCEREWPTIKAQLVNNTHFGRFTGKNIPESRRLPPHDDGETGNGKPH